MGTVLASLNFSADQLEQVQNRTTPGDIWWVYLNQDMADSEYGKVVLMAIGPNREFREPPQHYPCSAHPTGWRYRPIGTLDVRTGKVTLKGDRMKKETKPRPSWAREITIENGSDCKVLKSQTGERLSLFTGELITLARKIIHDGE